MNKGFLFISINTQLLYFKLIMSNTRTAIFIYISICRDNKGRESILSLLSLMISYLIWFYKISAKHLFFLQNPFKSIYLYIDTEIRCTYALVFTVDNRVAIISFCF